MLPVKLVEPVVLVQQAEPVLLESQELLAALVALAGEGLTPG